ncbi:hypothetical protein MANY_51860 [Mycolicibacterium anyangense]|uniref:Polysaccharide biosynthesis protein C-terminal domain-containing protein n=2 Tax=Mycolicibacterium anyangense TaxID=1431246 RepID=A0A6N4WFN0_9MYCO|nr:hypothetical protein MANY_51860 [Mycolicibacterium anyangense]
MAELKQSFSLRAVAAAVGMVCTFMLTVIVVRTLDHRDAASFFAILAALSIGPLIGRLGLGQNVTRLIPAEQNNDKRRVIAGTHLRATALLTIPSAPVVAFFATAGLVGHGDFLLAYLLTSAVIIIESLRLMLSDIFAAVGNVPASVATMHYIRSTMVLPVVGLLAFTLTRPTLTVLLSAYVAVALLQFLVALFYSRDVVALSKSAGFDSVRAAIGNGTKLFILELSWFLMMTGTIWLANVAFSAEAATHYSAAATIAGQVTILESLAALAITPPAARLWAEGKKADVVRLLSNVATVNTLVTSGMVAALFAFGGLALQVAYGPAVRDASVILAVMAASGVVQAALNANITLLIISGHLYEVARTAVILLAFALPCSITAAYLGGPLPLAISASASVAMLSIAEWMTARRVLDEAPHPHRHVITAVRELLQRPSPAAAP